MCQQQVKDPKSRALRQCKMKGDPFCKRHSRLQQEVEEVIEVIKETPKAKSVIQRMMETPVDLFVKGSCFVCMDDKKIYPTNCCEFKICRSCLIKNAKTECCHCKKELNLDESTKDLIMFIQDKDKQMNEMSTDLMLHQSIANNPLLMNIQNIINNTSVGRRARRNRNNQ